MQTEQKSQRSGGGVGRKISIVYLILSADTKERSGEWGVQRDKCSVPPTQLV